MKIIIFDSSTIINFALNGILYIIERLRKDFPGKFIITREVKKEVFDFPLKTKRFGLEALQIGRLIENKTFSMPEEIGINSNEITKKTKKILDKINHSFFARNSFINLIHVGEASCIALSLLASLKNIENVVAIDERTTRMLYENPENLRKLLEKKLHTPVIIKGKLSGEKIKFIRSSELVYIAYKKNLIGIKGKNLLESLLYATKFKGCSISEKEIKQIEQLNKKGA